MLLLRFYCTHFHLLEIIYVQNISRWRSEPTAIMFTDYRHLPQCAVDLSFMVIYWGQSPSLGSLLAKFLLVYMFACMHHVRLLVGGALPHNALHSLSRGFGDQLSLLAAADFHMLVAYLTSGLMTTGLDTLYHRKFQQNNLSVHVTQSLCSLCHY